MARRFVRDARGRFASKGYVGQTGGRGARLKAGAGNTRTVSGEKRGERHILRSKESKAAGRVALDAAIKAGKTISPTKYGGLGLGPKTPQGAAAMAASRKANAAVRQAKLKSGLPQSSVRIRGLKRDPNVGQKLEANKTSNKVKPATKSGRETMKASVRKVQNQKVRNLNQQIKEAGPNAAGLRLEKLKVQSRMSATRATPTAKQTAKSAQRNDAIRARSAELRRQAGRVNRAYANQERTADTRNRPGSSMIRRPSRKTTRGAIRAEQALKFYRDPKGALKSVNKKRPGFKLPRGMR